MVAHAATADLAFPAWDLPILRRPRPATGILRRVQREAGDLELERAWVDRAKAGDRAALRSILEKYGPILYRAVLLPRLGDDARARDALGDTYAKVGATVARYEWHPAGIYPWLRTIAFHVAIDMLRARKRETPFDVDDLQREADRVQDVSGTDVAYLEHEEAARARTKVEAALTKINPRYAEAIRLRVLQERPREEVAKALGATPATFDVILHRAMAALRKVLTAEGSPDSDRLIESATRASRASHG
ncbi:MAG: RNA polymerase sigma factor [Deltaproteobacteria bacterium]|nr:RNA polymerase sigma factor [Deltaproteobacteria bacterium]